MDKKNPTVMYDNVVLAGVRHMYRITMDDINNSNPKKWRPKFTVCGKAIPKNADVKAIGAKHLSKCKVCMNTP